ncbi:uncharacterized protein J3D65DRAFT_642454 [Phyllosticta citribraziliensis]|uniref:Secreted protein n=1 Tax=Phyllosticta citribraziliensis TaxID=989973 RepID=A0ABR1L4D5_9PEZI
MALQDKQRKRRKASCLFVCLSGSILSSVVPTLIQVLPRAKLSLLPFQENTGDTRGWAFGELVQYCGWLMSRSHSGVFLVQCTHVGLGRV